MCNTASGQVALEQYLKYQTGKFQFGCCMLKRKSDGASERTKGRYMYGGKSYIKLEEALAISPTSEVERLEVRNFLGGDGINTSVPLAAMGMYHDTYRNSFLPQNWLIITVDNDNFASHPAICLLFVPEIERRGCLLLEVSNRVDGT
jgi:hypothetical protein